MTPAVILLLGWMLVPGGLKKRARFGNGFRSQNGNGGQLRRAGDAAALRLIAAARAARG